MTEQHKRLVRESFAEVRPLAGPLSLLFYGRLFELDPSLRPLFHGDIARQGRKLMDMLTAVADNLDQVDGLLPVLQAMGQRHAGYGVQPGHYAVVEEALLWALGQAAGDGLDADTKAAWRAVLSAVSAGMQSGAALIPLPTPVVGPENERTAADRADSREE